MGPRYLAVAPGLGAPQRHFIGLSEPPVVEAVEVGDLEIIVQATQRGGLRRGAPVTYRQVPVGRVMSVGLASDGGAVEARIYIQKAYAPLVRERTRFFSIGGLEADDDPAVRRFERRALERPRGIQGKLLVIEPGPTSRLVDR